MDADESFDASRVRRLIGFVLEQGADALMATARTGEASLLTPEEILAVWDSIFEKAGGRAPVVPAVISTTTRRAVLLVRAAESRGARAFLAVPILPALYSGRSYDDVYGFYADLAAATPLPIILFNYPSLTGIDFANGQASVIRFSLFAPGPVTFKSAARFLPSGPRLSRQVSSL